MNNSGKPFGTAIKRGIVGGAILFSIFSFAFIDDLFEVSKNFDIFGAAYKDINLNYVDEIKPSEMMKTGIDAMLEELDPYT